jgi:hypothetical protein
LPVYELVVVDAGFKITPMKEGDCITKKELRWDLIDLEAPLYMSETTGSEPVARNSAATTVATSPSNRSGGHLDLDADRLHLG